MNEATEGWVRLHGVTTGQCEHAFAIAVVEAGSEAQTTVKAQRRNTREHQWRNADGAPIGASRIIDGTAQAIGASTRSEDKDENTTFHVMMMAQALARGIAATVHVRKSENGTLERTDRGGGGTVHARATPSAEPRDGVRINGVLIVLSAAGGVGDNDAGEWERTQANRAILAHQSEPRLAKARIRVVHGERATQGSKVVRECTIEECEPIAAHEGHSGARTHAEANEALIASCEAAQREGQVLLWIGEVATLDAESTPVGKPNTIAELLDDAGDAKGANAVRELDPGSRFILGDARHGAGRRPGEARYAREQVVRAVRGRGGKRSGAAARIEKLSANGVRMDEAMETISGLREVIHGAADALAGGADLSTLVLGKREGTSELLMRAARCGDPTREDNEGMSTWMRLALERRDDEAQCVKALHKVAEERWAQDSGRGTQLVGSAGASALNARIRRDRAFEDPGALAAWLNAAGMPKAAAAVIEAGPDAYDASALIGGAQAGGNQSERAIRTLLLARAAYGAANERDCTLSEGDCRELEGLTPMLGPTLAGARRGRQWLETMIERMRERTTSTPAKASNLQGQDKHWQNAWETTVLAALKTLKDEFAGQHTAGPIPEALRWAMEARSNDCAGNMAVRTEAIELAVAMQHTKLAKILMTGMTMDTVSDECLKRAAGWAQAPEMLHAEAARIPRTADGPQAPEDAQRARTRTLAAVHSNNEAHALAMTRQLAPKLDTAGASAVRNAALEAFATPEAMLHAVGEHHALTQKELDGAAQRNDAHAVQALLDTMRAPAPRARAEQALATLETVLNGKKISQFVSDQPATTSTIRALCEAASEEPTNAPWLHAHGAGRRCYVIGTQPRRLSWSAVHWPGELCTADEATTDVDDRRWRSVTIDATARLDVFVEHTEGAYGWERAHRVAGALGQARAELQTT